MAENKEEPIENKGENRVIEEKINNPMIYVFINIQVNVPQNEKEKTTVSLDWIEKHIRRNDYPYPGDYWHSEWICERVYRGHYPSTRYEYRQCGNGFIAPPTISISPQAYYGGGVSIGIGDSRIMYGSNPGSYAIVEGIGINPYRDKGF
jgi:hypothetical protein